MPNDNPKKLPPSSPAIDAAAPTPPTPNCEGARLNYPDSLAAVHPAAFNATIPARDETLPLCLHCLLRAIHTERVVCSYALDDAASAPVDAPPLDAEDRTKKEQILFLYEHGVTEIAEIVRRVEARPSYVAQVLQSAGLLAGYFDLYTTTAREQNVYSRFFRNVLSFKNADAARESVEKLHRLYCYFERLGDRAGQHEATLLALLGRNRARWSGKTEESEIFAEWLNSH